MAKDIVEYKAKDGQLINLNIETVRKYLIRGNNQGATTQEIIFFMGICKSRGLNPFKNDCYPIKYGNDPMAIITSIDYFRARAKAQSDCMGWNSGIIVKDKETGAIRKTNGLFDKDNEVLLGGWFEGLPKGWKEPCKLEINLFGYIKKTKDGKVTQFWHEDKQPTMIAKVAESQGLRKCWPDEFQGIYSEAEIVREEIEEVEKPQLTKETYAPKEISNLTQKEFEERIKSLVGRREEPTIASFSKLNKVPLQNFEKVHRDEIPNWPESVRQRFKEKWLAKTKEEYEVFLRRLDVISGKIDTASVQTVKPGEGMVVCPETQEHVPVAYCKNARGSNKPCEMYESQQCLERFPE